MGLTLYSPSASRIMVIAGLLIIKYAAKAMMSLVLSSTDRLPDANPTFFLSSERCSEGGRRGSPGTRFDDAQTSMMEVPTFFNHKGIQA